MNHYEFECQIACKEWAAVCTALGEGRQTILLRKGGIAEAAGPGQLQLEHEQFWLYPTQVHQAQQGLRAAGPPARPQAEPSGTIELRWLAMVRDARWIESEAMLDALEPFHVLTRETVLRRFRYRRPGLWAILVRVFEARLGHVVLVEPEHEGCKTWVLLAEPLAMAHVVPVIDDARFGDVWRDFDLITGAGA